MPSKKNDKKNVPTIRSSAAEYLTYIASIGGSDESFEFRYEDENIWLTQRMLSEVYSVSVAAINQHIKKIYEDGELDPAATIKKYLIVQTEGTRQVSREIDHYNLQMIIAVGFKVNNLRAVAFRKWANKIVEQYTIKGWAMDTERLKNGGTLTEKYFEEQLETIREIRLSERKFYQKVTDLYATALDYDSKSNLTREFFRRVQAKLHFAVHGHTPSEIIYDRANAKKPHMGLTTWKDAPRGKIRKSDVTIAKNYLSTDELNSLELIVTAYLDLAELYAKRRVPLTMEDWAKHLDRILTANEHELLTDGGKIATEVAEAHAISEFEKYRVIQDRLFESDYDRYIRELEELTANVEDAPDE